MTSCHMSISMIPRYMLSIERPITTSLHNSDSDNDIDTLNLNLRKSI